jgi:hypothetical protein
MEQSLQKAAQQIDRMDLFQTAVSFPEGGSDGIQ